MNIFIRNFCKKHSKFPQKLKQTKSQLNLALLFAIFFANNSFANDFAKRESCQAQNGIWREFGNNCADNCYLDRGYKKLCISLINPSCDCLEDRCWNGEKCIDEKTFQIQAKKEEEERLKRIEEEIPGIFITNKNVVRIGDINNDTKSKNSNSVDINQNSKKQNKNNVDPTTSCQLSGGIWKKFPNGCADSCSSKTGPAICASVITESCDCGQNKCWDGASCTTY